MALQRLAPMAGKSSKLEQYPTPADIAADMVWEAYAAGDIEGMRVCDLGCGNGILAIGAALMGAKEVIAVDVDPKAVGIARRNAEEADVVVGFSTTDVSDLEAAADTVLQNPPFGAQTRHADRIFVRKAVETAPTTYSLHMDGTERFVEGMVQSLNASCELVKRYKFEIPYAFDFHRKVREDISVVLLRFLRDR
jgi:putative methylase